MWPKWQLWWPDNFCTLLKNKFFDTFGKLCTWKNQVTILNFQNKHSLEKILQPETEWVNLSERYMSCFFTNCKKFSSKKATVVECFTERTIVNLAMWTKQKNFLKTKVSCFRMKVKLKYTLLFLVALLPPWN